MVRLVFLCLTRFIVYNVKNVEYRNLLNFHLVNYRGKNVRVKKFHMKKLNENNFTQYIIIHAIYNYTRDI